LGFGEVQIAFVDFSSVGISHGVPQDVKIFEGTLEEPSDKTVINEHERTTVHADGKVVWHWAVHCNTPSPMDRTVTPLESWDMILSNRFELIWSPEYLIFTQQYFSRPKPLSHTRCLRVPVEFEDGATSSVIFVGLVKPTDDMLKVQQVMPLDEQLYILKGGIPWVLVAMSNVKTPQITELSTVGRFY
jgi:hypothetical protein